uniref:Uncharacterized protein n=1 Tax=Cucumis melo TaxID=3656 RepID=A0A9I9E3P5_CUCME
MEAKRKWMEAAAEPLRRSWTEAETKAEKKNG